LRSGIVPVIVMPLAACSWMTLSSPRVDNEIALKPMPQVRSSAAIEGLKINRLYNAGNYKGAYDQVRIWSGDHDTVSSLFGDPTVTSHALQVCAWSEDEALHRSIARQSNSSMTSIGAHKAIANRMSSADFAKLSAYYQCYLRSSPPSLAQCTAQVRDMVRMTPDYREVWMPAK